MAEIDLEGIKTNKQAQAAELDKQPEHKPWEAPDAPPGSTRHSLMVHDPTTGRPVRVLGPTHYLHLADGRVVGGYNGCTHYSEPGPDGDKMTRIVASHGAA